MQKTGRMICLAVVLLSATSFGITYRWTKADGGWHVPATWGGATSVAIPKAGDWALVTNSVYVIADNWKEMDGLSIGKSGVSGEVLVSSGGELTPLTARVGDGAYGSLAVDGGVFSTSNDLFVGYQTAVDVVVSNGTLNSGRNLYVARGYSGNYAGSSGATLTIHNGSVGVENLLGMGVSGQASGYITVSGGSLMVTNGLILDQGVFTVEGSSASITLAKNVALAQLDIRANATVKFVFDASGVSEIGFNNKTLELYEGASIEIDGSSFAGGVGTYRLLNAGAFAATGTNRFSNVTITGFDSFASATLEYDDAAADVSLVLANASPYEEWMTGFSLSEALGAMDADPDGDSFNNLLEYALGGDPTNSALQGTVPAFGIADGWLEYVHAERTDAESRGLNYSAQTVTNLVSGTWATNDVEFVGSGTLNDDFILVTNRVPADEGTRFIRLNVQIQE